MHFIVAAPGPMACHADAQQGRRGSVHSLLPDHSWYRCGASHPKRCELSDGLTFVSHRGDDMGPCRQVQCGWLADKVQRIETQVEL